MPPKKQNKEILHITTTGDRMKALICLVKRYSDSMADSGWTFHKKGIQIHSVDAGFVCMLEVTVGKDFFESYKSTKEFELGLEVNDLEKLREICALAGEQELTIRITENMDKFLLKYGNVNRNMDIPRNEITKAKGDSLTNVYNNSKVIGKIKMEEMRLFLRASATWDGDSERISTVEKKGKSFEMSTQIEEKLDEVVLDLNKAMDNKFKDKTLKILLLSKNLNTALKQMTPLTSSIVMRGNTDFPMMIMAKDRDPEDRLDFKEEINWWFMLAPRIESD